MRQCLEYLLFGVVGLGLIWLVLWLKQLLFEHQWFGVSTASFGVDGLIIWVCLMMAVKPAYNLIVKNINDS
ncbi:MAG: hypothetical protein JKX76_03745 [Colwellia sp.]|nr:hypothetical protein [Colwellia sp.]